MNLLCTKCETQIIENSGLTRAEEKILNKCKLKCMKIVCTKCEAEEKGICELKELFESLKIGMDEIRAKIEKNKMDVDEDVQIDKVIQEMELRKKKAKNIILYDVEESKSNDLKIRIDADMNNAKNAFKPIEGCSNQILKVIRIGKQSKSGNEDDVKTNLKIRPLKVIFTNETDVLKILRNKKRIKKYKLAADLTNVQKNCISKIKNEFKERQNNGETNITMKYVDGFLKILPKNEN